MNLPELSARTEASPDDKSRGLRPYRGKPDPKAAARWRRWLIGVLIHLAESEPETLLSSEGAGDLLNLARDLLRSVVMLPRSMDPDISVAKDMPFEHEMREFAAWLRANPRQLKAAVGSLQELLAAVADGGRFEWKFVEGSRATFDGAALKGDAPQGGCTFFSPLPRLDQAITLSAMLLLSKDEGAMVRRCARETCRRIFLASRPKQMFCSRRCASAAVFERYKQKLGEEEYRAKRREVARRGKLRNRRRSRQRKEQ